MTWPGWFWGLLIGIVLTVVAHWAIGQAPDTVSKLVADIELVEKAVGFVGVAIGLGSLSVAAVRVGFAKLDMPAIAGPGVLAIASALLLI